MDIIFTGATGFIGYAIAKHLKKVGHSITAVIRKTSNVDKLKKVNIDYIEGDIQNKDNLITLFKGKDVVIHCAGFVTDWGKKGNFIKTNYFGTKNVIEATVEAGVKRFIYVSTVDVFGHKKHIVINEKSPLGKRPGWYGKSKIKAEKLVREYIKNKTLDISIIYPPWVYGEGDLHFVPEIIDALKSNSMMFFRNKGKHTIEISYIENLVKAVETILNNDNSIGEGYIIADEPKISFRDFVNAIAEKLEYKKVNFTLPYPITYFAATLLEAFYKLFRIKKRPLLTRHSITLLGNDIIYDTSKIKNLGFKQKYNFEEAINKTLGKDA